ncbi:hypothetical protein AB0939_12010 [Streptomyces sp. NPDC006990]|uniref:hypothetical protein n=1 Tax=Streptomyces sp. NPDC006990 TaxID=3154481 RepID=UPI0034526AF7
MTSLDLVPGKITTREEVALSYGGSVYSGGIVPAPRSQSVFIYSDPAAGEKHGYTFDGWAEEDEFGPLYLYTGAGAVGDQEMVRGNKVLMETLTNGFAVHLFVANGKVPGKKEMHQRYVGQVVLDPVEPCIERQAPGSDGEMRSVFVFRLRPAEDAPIEVSAADAVKPAMKTTKVKVPRRPRNVKVPAQSGAKGKQTENHTTTETVANIPGGPRKVRRREGQLCMAFEEFLEAAGHECASFQFTVKGEPGTLTPDLYDATDHVLYEAKGAATRNHARMALGQLKDYQRFIDEPGLRLAVLLPEEPTPNVRALLEGENITLVVQTDDGFSGYPLQSPAV